MANSNSAKLAQQIWAIANSLRGNMDSSKFKDYILGVIFYRYLSAHTESYMDDLLRNDGVTYREALADPELAPEVKRWAIEKLGYLIEPDDLFDSLVARIGRGEFSIEDFERAISKLTASTVGQKSEAAFAGLFDAMNLQDTDLGKEVSARTKLISQVICKIYDTPFAKTSEAGDVLGTAYMILIGLFQSNAGKKGGEFFTPTSVSTLLAQITTIGLTEVRNVCDACAGSGSLLLEVARHLPSGKVSHYWAQEKMGTTYNLLRMNLIMHGVDYGKFTVFNDDTLIHDNFYENDRPVTFDIQVENPPYSATNTAADEKYLEDPRYRAAGVLAPSSKADLAFVESIVYHMADDGRAAVLLPHGVLFRGGSELEIRKYLIDTLNVVDAVIGLPANMFHGTGIPVCVLFLKKKRNGDSGNIYFIDASKSFEKAGKQNQLRACDVRRIVDAMRSRADIDGFARKVTIDEIHGNDCNLNIPRYVDASEAPEAWDVYSLLNGGVPVSEVDALSPYFDEFDGLRDSLFEPRGHALALKAEVREAVMGNPSVLAYLDGYAHIVGKLGQDCAERLIDRMDSVDARKTQEELAGELFAALEDVPFVDAYDAYQALDDAWYEISADVELVQAEGLDAVAAYEPNMVLKKKSKSKELVEEQDGWRGRVLPFELVQAEFLADDLAELKALKAAADAAGDAVDEAMEALTDEDKGFEVNGSPVWDDEKDKLVVKQLNAAVKQIKKQGCELAEDSTESHLIALADARAALSAANKALRDAKKRVEPSTMEVMDGLTEEQCLMLLRKKWVEPYIARVAALASAAVEGLIAKICGICDKYEVSYGDEDAEIAELSGELAGMLGKLVGDECDVAGVRDWATLLQGVE